MAALRRHEPAAFEQAIADTDLRSWILHQQQADQDRWKMNSTPSFVDQRPEVPGEMNFDAFRKLLPGA